MRTAKKAEILVGCISAPDSGNSVYGGQTAKNIYLGETRIVTKLNGANDPTYQEEYYKQYFYHSDHLGSASLISDYKGDEYQRIEYTPYGETWVEKTSNTGMEYLPYKFTAKELDEETGLYYYGARYLDPKYSMWISTDPALGEYIPIALTNDEAKKHNSNLPGMGGVFNHINFNLYHYAGNSPVKYTDPDGRAAYSIKNGDGSYSFTTSTNLFEKEMINSFGFIPFGVSGISLMFRLCGIREITDSNVMEIATYATDSLGNLDKFNSIIDLSIFAKVGKVAGNIGTGLTLYSLGSEFFGRESLTIDNVIPKTVGSYIKGKSHEAVSKSYNYAKTQILKMISTGKLSYKVNKNCEIEYIKFDKETHSEIKKLIKELKQMEQNNE